jgi:alpha-N-arabinofuranosidase
MGTRGWLDGADLAGLKLLASTDSLIANNHIYRCRGPAKAGIKGIWLDWMAQGARVTGNLLHENDWDLYVEVSHGPTLVDNNLLLSENGLRDWAQGLAVVHNMIGGEIECRTVKGRRTPWFSAHSLKEMKLANTMLKDARFYNNLLGAEDPLAPYRASGQLEAAGNARLDRKEISLEERQDGWWLSFQPDTTWADITRPLVTTKLLGKARITGQPFKRPNKEPYRIDRDYLGRKRLAENPAPGPFQLPGGEKVSLKVWPRK